jgi:hypothetical protein
MKKETISDLTTDEFNPLVENFIDREDDRIEPSTPCRTGRWQN